MATETEQRFILKALREVGDQLLDAFYGLDEEQQGWRPSDGEWSLKEIAAHLRDAAELAHAQINAILDGRAGPIPAWDIDVLPQERDYQGEDLMELLRACAGVRRESAYLLWGLMPEDWDRCGRHPWRGEVTLARVAREMAEHDLDHLCQVRRIKEQLRGEEED